MPDSPVVVLIGAPGAGKTRMGKRLAKLLDVPFIDTDKTIVAEHGPIAALFEAHGEPHFRAIERTHVSRALEQGAVVALGGGAVLDLETRAELAGHRVVLLTVTAEAVASRIDNAKRPLLKNGIEAWVALSETRRPIYESLARRTFDTSHRPLDDIATEISDWIKEETA
jgi:shikimate kinase